MDKLENYRYKVELVEDIPEYMGFEKMGEVESSKEWQGHSLGDPVGRIYKDGKIESFIIHDIETGTTDWFDILRNSGKLRQRHRNLINRKTWKEYECDEFYLMRRVIGHSSTMPTISDACLNDCINVRFDYTYEILLVADDGLRRYITETIHTAGPGAYSLGDVMSSLEDTFEEWAVEKEKGFKRNDDGELQVAFYDDYGEKVDLHFYSIDELMMCINSVRIIDLQKTITRRRGESNEDNEDD